jgi:hypothetical protein
VSRTLKTVSSTLGAGGRRALAVFSDALEAELSNVTHPSGTASNG